MHSQNFEKLSILIIGYDGYIDVWNHDVELLNKYWPSRPRTYLANSELQPEYNNIKIINAGSNSEWSRKVQYALDKIDTPYVLLMLEDFFITDYVNNQIIDDVMDLIIENKIKYYQVLVQLIKQTWEKGEPFKGNPRIHIIPKDKKYGLNLQAAIWNKDFLRETVGDGNYNAWEFEVRQLGVETYNVEKIEYLIDDRNILNIEHMIVQSKYLPGAIRKLARIGHKISLSERAQLSFFENFKYMLKLFMYSITPKCLVKPAKILGRFIGVDFVTDRVKVTK